MRTVTHSVGILGKSHVLITTSTDTREVVTSFTSSDYIQNMAHVHMSPTEARRYAQLLIIAANKLDPIDDV